MMASIRPIARLALISTALSGSMLLGSGCSPNPPLNDTAEVTPDPKVKPAPAPAPDPSAKPADSPKEEAKP